MARFGAPGNRSSRAAVGYAAASGRHRLPDGDVVPIEGYRRFADIINGPTRELPVMTSTTRYG